MDFQELETDRLKLVEITDEYIESYYSIMSKDEVTKYYGMPSLTNRYQAENIVHSFRDNFAVEKSIRWGIIWKETNAFIGTVGLNNWSPFSRKAEVGYELDPSFWRKRITSEAVSAVVDYAFRELGLYRLGAVTFPQNEASSGLLRRLGFKEEGVLRGYLFQDDQNHDALMFSRLQKEYLKEEF
ncbi:GNAT family N-acetyltransferase [Halobacillus sp. Nhm2S1]|uniref:GNAT family N-acetyltransferase n=1 Tax=Halobacillus sp. Nhm2S1 TaxID=2866716 RepID=UPI001C72EAA4|nr:GNAT family N-acetyltransferase [Halobacillus sp. Nhm2S1]MBX0358410.1 GNAT family N-acetyltransferase [Halobacillus sp. Nhm2S1]